MKDTLSLFNASMGPKMNRLHYKIVSAALLWFIL